MPRVAHWWALLLLCVFGIRVGEATVPGPTAEATQSQWTLGVCNPSGLPGKSQLLAAVDSDIIAISETHLTEVARSQFHRSLRTVAPAYTHFVTGAPLPLRSCSSVAGSWAGVAVASKHPTRLLPAAWPPDLYETGRVVFSTSHVSNLWISGAVIYGFPEGQTHVDAKPQTELALDFAFNRMQALSGPRFMSGDWNFEAPRLDVCRKLQDAGWIEVQSLHQLRTGTDPQPTCKGVSRKDHLWLSPELATGFRDLVVDPHGFADHSTLVARFLGGKDIAARYLWPTPRPVDWTQVPALHKPVSFDLPLDPDVQYASLWLQKEQQAAQTKHWHKAAAGRAQQSQPRKRIGWAPTVRQGRFADDQPAFYGNQVQHTRWFRQLRRLKSYCDWLRPQSSRVRSPEHGILLWRSILSGTGFSPSFEKWWPHRSHCCVGDVTWVPQFPPPLHVAVSIYETFKLEVRSLEYRLNQSKALRQKAKYEVDPNLVFRDVKRTTAQPVDSLFLDKQSKVTQVLAEECALEIHPPVDFAENEAVFAGGRQLRPIHFTEDKLWVENPEDFVVGQTVVQQKPLGSLEVIFKAFHEQWRARWCRHDHVEFSHWNELVAFAKHVCSYHDLPKLCIDRPLFRAEVARKRKHTSTGLDGVSRQDLIQADDATVDSYLNMFLRAELEGRWPKVVTSGKVVSLAKVEAASSPSQFRPITVFSLAYRCWSSLNARYCLQAADTWVHPDVYGNRPHKSAANLWRVLVSEVEKAYDNSCPLSGLTADIKKCYNCLPRSPILQIALVVGTPFATVHAWAGALAAMTRHFQVRGSYSSGFVTSTGMAEGCGLSCYAMLLTDHIFHLWSEHQNPAIRVLSYVDNWDMITPSADAAIQQLDLALGFAALCDLTVDRGKTYCWSTSAELRQSMRRARIPVKHYARDLGAHIGYSRQYTNATVRSRIDALDSFWQQLKRSQAPHKLKLKAVRSVALPRGLHAISAAPLGFHVWVHMRRKITDSLAFKKAGLSSALFVALVEPSIDPQLYALLATVRDARAFCSFTEWDQVVAPYAQHGTYLNPNGPSKVLVDRLHTVGLFVESAGRVRDAFGSFSVLRDNYSEVRVRLEFAWAQVAAAQVSHRVDFRGLDKVDAAATHAWIASLHVTQQKAMKLCLAGAFFTEDSKAHWTDGPGLCRWCGQPDSLQHRYWECPQTQHLRHKLAPDASAVLELLPPALTLHSWHLLPPSRSAWLRSLGAINREVPFLSKPLHGSERLEIFTDGSCFFQDDRVLRLAAWSVVLAPKFDASWTLSVPCVLAAGHLPGLAQHAFRAELFALAIICHHAALASVSVRVWSDCLGVVNKFQLLTKGKLVVGASSANGDLWNWIRTSLDSLPDGSVEVCKTPAHQPLNKATTRREAWQFWHNGCADTAAKMANRDRPSDVWQLWTELQQEQEKVDLLTAQVHALHLAVASMNVHAANREEPMTAVAPVPRQKRVFVKSWDVRQWTGSLSPDFTIRFGSEMASRFGRWWTRRTGASSCLSGDASNLSWVSFVHLYIDFQLTFGNPGPLKIGKSWCDSNNRPYLDVSRFAFRLRVRWFKNCLTWFWKLHGMQVALATTLPVSECVQAHVPCCSIDWDGWALSQAEGWLATHLRGTCSRDAKALRHLGFPSRLEGMAV